jgi:hypothetical protein
VGNARPETHSVRQHARRALSKRVVVNRRAEPAEAKPPPPAPLSTTRALSTDHLKDGSLIDCAFLPSSS